MRKVNLRISFNGGSQWSLVPSRKNLPCTICATPTKGRIHRTPMCMEDGMDEIMRPLRIIREQMLNLVRSLE